MNEIIDRLRSLADWHEQMGQHPMDVSGSDRQRHQRSKFHLEAAKDIREAIRSYEERGD